jgi:hypothetical protein
VADDLGEPDVFLRLRPQRIEGWPVAVRLKLLLKAALRGYGFRNVSLTFEQPPPGTHQMPQDARCPGPATGGPP